jgi:thiol-disulfide isomerase/thioredoxin
MKKIIVTLLVFWLGHSAQSVAGSLSLDDFSLTSLDGETVELADYRGKVVLVNFWASWCPPCVHELPSMQTLYENMEGQPFEVLALNMTEEPDQVKSFLDNFGTTLTFPVLLRADKSVADAWKVRGLPTTVILGKDGTRALTWQGPKEWDSAEVKALLQPLLDE